MLTVLTSQATPPIAHLTELHKNRRVPLLLGQGALIASQVMLMEAPKFWVMVIARVAQGVSASVIWVVGLALVYVSETLYLLRVRVVVLTLCVVVTPFPKPS